VPRRKAGEEESRVEVKRFGFPFSRKERNIELYRFIFYPFPKSGEVEERLDNL
jgi:hypothetical protein